MHCEVHIVRDCTEIKNQQSVFFCLKFTHIWQGHYKDILKEQAQQLLTDKASSLTYLEATDSEAPKPKNIQALHAIQTLQY